ncbi:MAG TPA: histidine ammonia-lyase [Solirubrobacteraceae bacterium]|jgi:histidine ammonia-lyase|nr:histidine ammonia-lyase [Solirubrobacteraceae bacterium]
MVDETVTVGGATLQLADVARVARENARAVLSPDAYPGIERSWQQVQSLSESGNPVYGISTGFGALSTTRIERDRWSALQHSLVVSHAAGMGPPVEREVVRAMMLLRARTLALGYSGVHRHTIEAILGLLNAGITPVVPEYGSLGASGDLAPLAHFSLALLGQGDVIDADGQLKPAAATLNRAGLQPLTLGSKEGLSLINGTDGMLGMLALACIDFLGLCRTADVAAAMSIEALLGTDTAFDAAVQALRPHAGQQLSAANLARLMADSEIVASHRENDDRVQDAYSMRCAPQVLGAARDVLDYARGVAEVELASAVDNPSVLADGRLVSNGNFHGVPLGFAADFLAIAAAEVGAIAERRIDRLLDVTRSMGLPAFLGDSPGLDSGLMIAQYTAAALVAENRRLAAPASVDSIPTSGMQEDHVSMGWSATRKLRRTLENLTRIVAVELLCSARALVLRAPLRPAPATAAVTALIDPRPGPDRSLSPELARVEQLVSSGAILTTAEQTIGALG